MRYLILLSLIFTGCATTKDVEKSDFQKTVVVEALYPIESEYDRVITALLQTRNWTIVDKTELETRKGITVIKAQQRCEELRAMWGKKYLSCLQTLILIDGDTKRVLSAVEHVVEGPTTRDARMRAPAWDETVQKLNERID